MPRTSRFTTEFDAGDRTWVAKFIHAHNEKDGILHCVDNQGTMVRGKHLTTCQLSVKGAVVFASGYSLCSMKETYQWQFGIKQAFNRALCKAGFAREDKI